MFLGLKKTINLQFKYTVNNLIRIEFELYFNVRIYVYIYIHASHIFWGQLP